MNTIDNPQRVAAKIAGASGLLAVVIVVFGNYALLSVAKPASRPGQCCGDRSQYRGAPNASSSRAHLLSHVHRKRHYSTRSALCNS